jgi:hypothetical protein
MCLLQCKYIKLLLFGQDNYSNDAGIYSNITVIFNVQCCFINVTTQLKTLKLQY